MATAGCVSFLTEHEADLGGAIPFDRFEDVTGYNERFVNLGIPGLSDAWRVGSGGSAAVFGSRDATGRPIAVKLLRWAVEPEEAERRFNQERRVLQRLGDHPGVVPILGSGITDRGELYFTMPLLQGSMSQVVSQRGPMEWEEAASLMLDVARTIEFAHGKGVLHCDLKPANLLLSEKGRPMVADFGISRLTDATDTASTRMAVSPSYAAPERFRDEAVTVRSDVYSLASTFWALVTGRPPFTSSSGKADSPEQIMARVLKREPPDLALMSDVPRPVAAVIKQAMAKNPADRPHSATAFAEQLRYAVAAAGGRVEETITIDVPSEDAWERMSVQPSAHEYKTRGGLWWAAAALLLPLALVAGLIWGLSGSDGDDVAVELGSSTATAVPTASAAPTAEPDTPDKDEATPEPTAQTSIAPEAIPAAATTAPAESVPAQPTVTMTPVPATATATVVPTVEPTAVVFPGLFQTPTPVPPTATPRPTPRPQPTAVPRPTAVPVPTATAVPRPTSTPVPPTATARPQPTAVPATAIPQPTAVTGSCPSGWSGPNASGTCSQAADAIRTPQLIVYACPQGSSGNPTPDNPTCSGQASSTVDAIRTERIVCPDGTSGNPTAANPYCFTPTSVNNSQVALQVNYGATLQCQVGSTGSPTTANPNCVDAAGQPTAAVVYQPPPDYVCQNGATPQSDYSCPVTVGGEQVWANIEISLQCPNGSSGSPTLSNPTCTRSVSQPVDAIVVENTPAGFTCPDGFSGTPTAADPVCRRTQPAI